MGENVLKITVTAENGDTKDYYISVVRMQEYSGTSGTVTEETTTESETTESETASPVSTTPEETTAGDPGVSTDKFENLPFWTVIIVGVLCAMTGFGGCFFVMRGRKE